MANNNYGINHGPSGAPYVDAENEREAAILENMGHRQGMEFIISLRASRTGDTREPSQIIRDIPPERRPFREVLLDALHLRFPAKNAQL